MNIIKSIEENRSSQKLKLGDIVNVCAYKEAMNMNIKNSPGIVEVYMKWNTEATVTSIEKNSSYIAYKLDNDAFSYIEEWLTKL